MIFCVPVRISLLSLFSIERFEYCLTFYVDIGIIALQRTVIDMAQTMVNFRMDETLKGKMDAVCREMGMSSSTAYTIFASKVVREHRIPFEINADPFYSEANMAFLRNAVSALNEGKGTEHELIEVE